MTHQGSERHLLVHHKTTRTIDQQSRSYKNVCYDKDFAEGGSKFQNERENVNVNPITDPEIPVSSYVGHMANHNDKKPFQCELCAYSTVRSDALLRHMRIHTGEKPFKCDVCQYAAKHKSSLDYHMKTHRGEKPYKCDVCAYSTANGSFLVIHKRTHTGEKPFKCDICPYSATSKRALSLHMMAHTDKKPYRCDACLYTTVYRKNLIRHFKTHKGEKPFQCDFCPYYTTHEDALVRHMRTHPVLERHMLVHCKTTGNKGEQSHSYETVCYRKDFAEENSKFQSDSENLNVKINPMIDQMFNPENSNSSYAQLSSDESYEKGSVSTLKIKEEPQDDGVQRWTVINSELKKETDIL